MTCNLRWSSNKYPNYISDSRVGVRKKPKNRKKYNRKNKTIKKTD